MAPHWTGSLSFTSIVQSVHALLFRVDNQPQEWTPEEEEEGDEDELHIDVDAHEVLQFLHDFAASAMSLHAAYSRAQERARRQRDSVVRNTLCLEELDREWMHDATIMRDLDKLRDTVARMKKTSVTSQHRADELDEELNCVKDACLRGMTILHSVAASLQHFSPPWEQDEAMLRERVAPMHSGANELGMLEQVFQQPTAYDPHFLKTTCVGLERQMSPLQDRDPGKVTL